jgi:hypothetical protein
LMPQTPPRVAMCPNGAILRRAGRDSGRLLLCQAAARSSVTVRRRL